ncbi:MAG: DUF4832 domain-containing protein [Oscillospiraceae bacterium]|nr:DUF4832 domain-containing protein [Oscillospiraceae bacterium]
MEKTLRIPSEGTLHILPGEDRSVVLHNPDMGWVLYDNHVLSARPGNPPHTGRYENHIILDESAYDYPDVDNISLYFSWSDIEIAKDVYDFTYYDAIYDFWTKKGKQVVSCMASETKVWYRERGQGAPTYLLEYLGEKGTRKLNNGKSDYYLCDISDPYYQERLRCYLTAFQKHMKETNRLMRYMDLRGYGMWGEWHTGFMYPDLETKREALGKILEIWTSCLPDTCLALSYSYDPDEPYENYNDPNRYQDYLRWSAYDLAQKYPNLTLRRDGAGQEVKNCERMFCEDMFKTLDRGPFTAEGCNGYDPRRTVEYIVKDGLSLHPNYFTVIGWGGSEARRFIEDYPDLIREGLLNMGYRMVLTYAAYKMEATKGETLSVDARWINRAVGRAPRNYEVRFLLKGEKTVTLSAGMSGSSKWIKDGEYPETYALTLPEDLPAGSYQLGIGLYDPVWERDIKLPMEEKIPETEFCALGKLEIKEG